jgi:hypothetical protein
MAYIPPPAVAAKAMAPRAAVQSPAGKTTYTPAGPVYTPPEELGPTYGPQSAQAAAPTQIMVPSSKTYVVPPSGGGGGGGLDTGEIVKWSAIGLGVVAVLGGAYYFMSRRQGGTSQPAMAGFGAGRRRRGPYRGKRGDFDVTVWEERDRLHIGVTKNGDPIDVDWWDDDARQMIEDGFFKSGQDLKRSVLDYVEQNGLVQFTGARFGGGVKPWWPGRLVTSTTSAFYTDPSAAHEKALKDRRQGALSTVITPETNHGVHRFVVVSKWRKSPNLGDGFYHTAPSEFTPGQRVQLHPGMDLWMRGARYGTVKKIGRDRVHVEIDATGKTVTIPPSRLQIED